MTEQMIEQGVCGAFVPLRNCPEISSRFITATLSTGLKSLAKMELHRYPTA